MKKQTQKELISEITKTISSTMNKNTWIPMEKSTIAWGSAGSGNTKSDERLEVEDYEIQVKRN